MAVSGAAFGGQPPITGSTITLFATGQSGYGSNGTVLGSATTDSHGNFNIASATGCGDPEQVYIVATGGNPGLTAGTNNSAIVLVAALGNCSSVSATTHINLNEVTTIAAAYALSGFAGTGVKIGTSATNPLRTPARLSERRQHRRRLLRHSPLHHPRRQRHRATAVINSLADILEPCVNSTSPASGAPALRSSATRHRPPSPALPLRPTPGRPRSIWPSTPATRPPPSTASMLGTPSFLPTLGATFPNDLSIGITYTAGLGTNGATSATAPFGIAADANDNLWITGATAPALSNFPAWAPCSRPTGAGETPPFKPPAEPPPVRSPSIAMETSGPSTTPRPAAISTNTTPPPQQPTITTPGSVPLSGIAVDGGNNIWYSTESASGSQVFGQLAYNSGLQHLRRHTNDLQREQRHRLRRRRGSHRRRSHQQRLGSVAGSRHYQLLPQPLLRTRQHLDHGRHVKLRRRNRQERQHLDHQHQLPESTPVHSTRSRTATPPEPPSSTTPPPSGLGLDGLQALAIDGNDRLFLNSAAANTLVEFDPAIGTHRR